jgi:hypothetical protein
MEQEIRSIIKKDVPLIKPSAYGRINTRQPLLQDIIEIKEKEREVDSALNIVYAASSFMSVDRITKKFDDFKRNRRIIYYLDSRMGQIGSILLLHLLKCKNMEEFSKHKLVQKIDEEIFQSEGINVSTGEITEALSRMFRKTMSDFFEIQGKSIVKKPYVLKVQELKLNHYRRNQYNEYKHHIDLLATEFIGRLNRSLI